MLGACLSPRRRRPQADRGRRRRDPLYLLQGEDEVEKSALAHEFEELVEEGLRAFNVERIHAGDVTTGDKLARRRRVAGRGGAHAADDGAAARRHRAAGRRAAGAQARKRGGDAGARRARSAAQAARAADDAGAGRRRRSTSAAGCTSCCQKQATLVECGVARGSGGRRALGPNRVAAAGAQIEPAAARLLAERAGTDVKRLRNDVDRLLLYALGQKTITVDDVREIAGPAALQDDWAMTNAIEAGDGGDGAAAAGADARRRRAAGEDPRSARLAGADEVSRASRRRGLRPARRGAVPHRPRPEAIGRRSARAARAAGRRVVCGEAAGRGAR